MATKLSIYNKTLQLLGERRLASQYEDREPRYVLDEFLNADAYATCLELVKPRFAIKTVKLTSPTTSSVHSLDSVYSFPSDYISILEVPGLHGVNGSFFSDEDLEEPIDRYIIEGTSVACDVGTAIWMRYVALNTTLTQWTPLFADFVSAYLAKQAASRINPNRIDVVGPEYDRALERVRAIEAIKENDILPQKASGALSTDQLKLYSRVAHHLGASEFRHVTDSSGMRLAIDQQYDSARDYLLEVIKPRFATEFVTLTDAADSSVHGFDNVFTLPGDYLTLCELWSDQALDQPIARYLLEDTQLFTSNYATVYMRYIQDDAAESTWSPAFQSALVAYIALLLAPRYNPEREKNLAETFESALQFAIQTDQYQEPARRPITSTYTLTNTTRGLFNKALEILRLDPITSNTDESDRRVALDYAMNNKAVETVFELISWGFLYKSVKLEKDNAVDPEWGYQYAFTVPSDMIRIDAISADEYFRYPLDYYREGDYFFSDVDTLYLKYLSDEQETTPATWPTYVFNLVAAELARACAGLPGADADNAERKYKEYKYEAYNTDAQRNPPQVITEGSWNRSRYTYLRRRTERP